MLELRHSHRCSTAHYCTAGTDSHRVSRLYRRPAVHRYKRLRAAAISPLCGSVTVIGAGAAGLTAAYFAALGGAEVTVLERNAEAGRKILISGGTRSNVLPMEVDVGRDFFTESSPAALRGVFSTWSLAECKEWLEHDLGLRLASEAATKKWFPASNDAREVRDRLVAACREQGVHIKYSASLESLRRVESPTGDHETGSSPSAAAATSKIPGLSSEPQPHVTSSNGGSSGCSRGGGDRRPVNTVVESGADAGWICGLQDGTQVPAQRLVLAAGGLSYPGLGTDGTVHRLVAGLGHKLAAPYPALTPLLGAHPGGAQLAGLSLYGVQLAVKAAKKQTAAAAAQRQALLFTHRGYSGPAVLDLSHHAVMALDRRTPPPALRVSWTGEDAATWEQRFSAGGGVAIGALMRRAGVPARLADALAAEAGAEAACQVAQLRRGQRAALVQLLSAYELPVTGHQGYAKAEVTGGGVRLAELNCGTMESRRMPGVHVAGELLDVFGRIGGFNFYWAWLSGRLAGRAAAAAVHGR